MAEELILNTSGSQVHLSTALPVQFTADALRSTLEGLVRIGLTTRGIRDLTITTIIHGGHYRVEMETLNPPRSLHFEWVMTPAATDGEFRVEKITGLWTVVEIATHLDLSGFILPLEIEFGLSRIKVRYSE